MTGHRPSKRRHRLTTDVELPLIPVMSLMVVLVPSSAANAVTRERESGNMDMVRLTLLRPR